MLVRQSREKDVRVYAEARGRKHDDPIREVFKKITRNGTKFKTSNEFKAFNWSIEFIPKSKNILGLQLADLVAYPIAKHHLTPPYPAYPTVKAKIYRGPENLYSNKPSDWIYGLKIFPKAKTPTHTSG